MNGPVDIEVERLRMQNLRDAREFWFRVVLVLVPTSASIGGNLITWSDTNRKLTDAAEHRVLIEEKLDEAKATTTKVAETAERAVQKAESTAEHVKQGT